MKKKDIYFIIPFYKKLRSTDGWKKENQLGTRYHIARAFFKLNYRSCKAGPSKIGEKLFAAEHPEGIALSITKSIEQKTEVFQEADTIKRSIIESECMSKILAEFTANFGNTKIFKSGGTVKSEGSSKIKSIFLDEFKITNTSRKKEDIKFEFTCTLPGDFTDRVCGVEVYQRVEADLYLIQVDYLDISYERTIFGLRKKIRKSPFPEDTCGNKVENHPNILKVGTPVATLEFWQLLPQYSVIIKDKDYRPEVIDNTDIVVKPPDSSLIERPYWTFKENYPTLYQLSNIAFPYKWINKKNNKYSRKELMKLELGEAEGTAWWFVHGPGRLTKN